MPDTKVQTSTLKNKKTGSTRQPLSGHRVWVNVLLQMFFCSLLKSALTYRCCPFPGMNQPSTICCESLSSPQHWQRIRNQLGQAHGAKVQRRTERSRSLTAADWMRDDFCNWCRIIINDRARVKHRPSSPWGRTDRKARPGPSLVTTVAPYFCAVAEQVGLSRKSGGNYTLEEKSKRQSLS